MKKIYFVPLFIFGIGLIVVLSVLIVFTNMNQLEINFHDSKVVITEEGYNVEKQIDIKDIKEIRYIECDDILYTSGEISGPSTKGGKLSRDKNLQNVSLNKSGIDTKNFAAGNGYSRLVGECEVYIYWEQKSYIILKTTEEYFILNKESDEETKNLYLELKKSQEKYIDNN